ncbi:hypothetical protein X798_00443, partial [Onchocerca flexuosa]
GFHFNADSNPFLQTHDFRYEKWSFDVKYHLGWEFIYSCCSIIMTLGDYDLDRFVIVSSITFIRLKRPAPNTHNLERLLRHIIIT